MDGLSGELLGALGPAALAGLAVLLVLTGRLIPLRTHQQALDAAKVRGEEWKAAFFAERDRAEVLAGHLVEILGAVKDVSREST